jgi:quercetin dioxygenase-like cupin family protein
MQEPISSITLISNIFVRGMFFEKAGDRHEGHSHCFDHLTLLAKGKLRICVNGVDTEFSAPHSIFIKADVVHELTALEDDTAAYCIHALRDKDSGDILDPSMIPAGVSPISVAAPICK